VSFLINPAGTVIAQATSSERQDYPQPAPPVIAQAQKGPNDVVIIPPGPANMIGAVTAVSGFGDALLYATRPIDPKVAGYLAMTNDSVAQYRVLEATRLGVQLAFGILFLDITVVVLLSAIWLGIGFANRLVAPIRRLIDAAKQVSAGNLRVEVQPRSSDATSARWRDLQHDDRAVAWPAAATGGGERTQRQPPPLHRGGAVGRHSRRDRHRFGRAGHHRQPHRATFA